jgi:hypothetical protein
VRRAQTKEAAVKVAACVALNRIRVDQLAEMPPVVIALGALIEGRRYGCSVTAKHEMRDGSPSKSLLTEP